MLDKLTTPISQAPAPATAFVPVADTAVTEKRKHSRPKGQERILPTDLASLRIALMREMGQERPDHRLLRLGERLLRSFESESRTTAANAEKDAEIQRLQKENDELRSKSSETSRHKKEWDALTSATLRVDLEQRTREVADLRNQLDRTTAENTLLKSKLDKVLMVPRSKLDKVLTVLSTLQGELWNSLREQIASATSEADFKQLDNLEIAAKETDSLIEGLKSDERGCHVK